MLNNGCQFLQARDSVLEIIDIGSRKTDYTLENYIKAFNSIEFDNISSCIFTSNKKFIFLAVHTGVYLIDAKTYKIISLIQVQSNLHSSSLNYVSYCKLTPDEQQVVICTPSTIYLYNIQSKQIVLFSGSPFIRGVRNGTKKTALFSWILQCTFSPDGRFLIVCEQHVSLIRTINMDTGDVKILCDIVDKSPETLHFTKNGKYMMFCYEKQSDVYVNALNIKKQNTILVAKIKTYF
jgi:WD40 repeat protein